MRRLGQLPLVVAFPLGPPITTVRPFALSASRMSVALCFRSFRGEVRPCGYGLRAVLPIIGIVSAVALVACGQRNEIPSDVLDAYQESFELVRPDDRYLGEAKSGSVSPFPILMSGGKEYFILGACDTRCKDLDLKLLDPTGEQLSADVLPDKLPLIEYSPPSLGQEPATYTLLVEMFDCTGSCAWEVRLYVSDSRDPATPVGTEFPPDRNDAFPYRKAELTPDDTTLDTGEHIDEYIFDAEEGDEIVVDLWSEDFDPILVVDGPGSFYGQNDDYDGNRQRSVVRFRASSTGSLVVRVTTYAPREHGQYYLRFITVQPDIEDSRQTSGYLGYGDDVTFASEVGSTYVDRYTFDAYPGDHICIDVVAEFDSFLRLRGPAEFTRANDDYVGRADRSRVDVDVPFMGTYTAEVSSYASLTTGEYSFSMRRTSSGEVESERCPETLGFVATPRTGERVVAAEDESSRNAEGPFTDAASYPSATPGRRPSGVGLDAGDARELEIGEEEGGLRQEGYLGLGDGEEDDGLYTDRWKFRVEERVGDAIRIEMRSMDPDTKLDPRLALVGPDGKTFSNSMCTVETLAACIEANLEVAGTYMVKAVDESGSERVAAGEGYNSNYVLQAWWTNPLVRTERVIPSAGIYGILVGIHLYNGAR